jgi:hypothetical protein
MKANRPESRPICSGENHGLSCHSMASVHMKEHTKVVFELFRALAIDVTTKRQVCDTSGAANRCKDLNPKGVAGMMPGMATKACTRKQNR